jgi:hypothetical protein
MAINEDEHERPLVQLGDLQKSSEENQKWRTLIQRVNLQESDEDG